MDAACNNVAAVMCQTTMSDGAKNSVGNCIAVQMYADTFVSCMDGVGCCERTASGSFNDFGCTYVQTPDCSSGNSNDDDDSGGSNGNNDIDGGSNGGSSDAARGSAASVSILLLSIASVVIQSMH